MAIVTYLLTYLLKVTHSDDNTSYKLSVYDEFLLGYYLLAYLLACFTTDCKHLEKSV